MVANRIHSIPIPGFTQRRLLHRLGDPFETALRIFFASFLVFIGLAQSVMA